MPMASPVMTERPDENTSLACSTYDVSPREEGTE
jgi:hypothetical protein